ncbi:MAG: ArdC family protein, partial [Nitrosomonas sp.]|nr:ArdC family protein [Nitrosomonas sp.]MCB1977146.1 ArdC family protein [Nitrosomonas sp.]
MDNSRKAYHEQVAESLIAQLKQGTAPWQKPWQPGDPLLSFPHNPTTKKRYRGINALYLMSQDYADPRWLT